MITFSIDLKKLDKTRFKEFKRDNGTDSLYANFIILKTKSGELIVKQSMTKQERESGLQLPILGNAKDAVPLEQAVKQIQRHVEKSHESQDDIPF